MSAAPSPTDQPAPSTGALMPLVSIRRHWRVGAAVALAVALLGAVVAWKKGKPLYSATTTIYVAPRFVNILREPKDFDVTSYQQFRQFVEHQTLTIGRYDILIAALNKLEAQHADVWRESEESQRRAAERLMAALKIVAVKDTYLITVSLESNKAEHLDTIVNTVVETYVDTVHKETLFYGQDQRSKSLGQRREELSAKVEAHKKRRTEIAQEIGVTTFTPNGANPYDEILMGSRTALSEAHRQTIAAQAALDACLAKADGTPSSALLAFASEETAKDAGLNSLKSNLLGRRAALLEKLSGLDEVHPLRRQIDRELKEIDEEIKRATTNQAMGMAQGVIEQRRGDLRKAQQMERELEKQVEAHRQKDAWYTSLYHEALTISDELERETKDLQEIDSRLEFFQLEQSAPGYVRIETPARPPELPISGGRKKLFMVALVAAAGLGLAVPVILDLLDRRIRTPGQAAKLLGYPPMAAFFEPSENVAVRRVDADRKRRLAIALERERRQREARVFLLTSVRPQAGVTGLALELALELEELGCRTLVIETNPLKPDARYQSDEKASLDDLLSGDEPGESAILPAAGRLPERIGMGFSVLPHLHNYARLRVLLDELKARYDVILLDTPPVLLSADTEFLASLADVTLLLIGAGQVVPGDLRRAVGILQKIDPAAVGFIVTHLEIYKGGGYFAQLLTDYGAVDEAAREVLKSHPFKQKPT